MKKILLLLLVLVGMVSTVNAKKIYLANNWDKGNVWVGVGDTEDDLEWTQLEQKYSYGDCKSDGGTNYSHSIYEIDLGTSTKFHITYTGEDFPVLSSEDFEDGGYYKFNWDGSKRGLTSITIYTYNFTVNTAATYSELKIYPFYESSPTSWVWGDSPIMSKSSNTYTYTVRTIYSSMYVIFKNDYQTCTLTAESGDNNYYIASMKAGSDNGEYVKTNASGYATFVSTNALTIPSYIAYYATEPEPANGSAIAHTITNPAGSTPRLMKGNASTTYHFATAVSGTSYSSTNAFHAGDGSTLDSGTGPYNYILNGDAFYAANGKKVVSGKAYLQLSAATPAGARPLVFEDEETTGIATVKAIKNDIYYNLQGVKVAQPMKGLFIKNGRKVVVK